MELGDLAFKLILILSPGILATMLYRRIIIKKKWESIDIGLNTLLFGILSYLLLQGFYNLCDWGDLIIWQTLQDNEVLPYKEIFWSAVWSIFVALIAGIIVNTNAINKVAIWLSISSKYGEENLFYTFLSSKNTNEIHLKDIDNNLVYNGYVKYYSEDENLRELILEDVDIYEYNTGKHFNKFSKLYISIPKSEKIIIEIPNSKEDAKT
jgi:hypothetical protein